MKAAARMIPILRAVRDARHAGDGPIEQDGWRVRRAGAGMNNLLYRVEGGGRAWAVKLCVADERRRAQHEYGALRLLERAGADLAPRPLGLDESGAILPYPAVVYGWLEGEPLSGPYPGGPYPGGPAAGRAEAGGALSEAQLAALLESVQGTHDIGPRAEAGLAEAWFHWFERGPYIEELHSFLRQYREWLCENSLDGPATCARLERVVRACEQALGQSPARIERESVPLRLCHVDPNPANAISGPDGQVRWVDWEYSGWGDPALDLAEFRWHEAFSFLSAEQVEWMRANYRPPAGDAGFTERLRLWDALLAARWPFLLLRRLWSLANGPDRERLSALPAQPVAVQTRLLELIERAEGFFRSRTE